MLQSMTGFVSKTIILYLNESNKANLTISIKSLNSRYLDITCKMPYIFNQFETDIIKLIKNKLIRGNINLILYLDDQNAFKSSVQPAIPTIKSYIDAVNKVQEQLKLPGQLYLNDILRIPNIFILEEKGVNEDDKKFIFNTINEILNELIVERKNEGIFLKDDLSQRIFIMQNNINEISKIFEKSINEQKEKVSKKIQEINELANDLTETQRQTLYLSLDKMDIHEEIARFISHLASMQKIINSSNVEKGKQLDFTLQELSREINTITAKTQVSQIIDLSIGIKVEIEKAREQTQNIV